VSDWVLYTPFITGDNTQIMVLGDVSLNGEVHAYDASLILQYLVTNIILTPDQLLNADVSGTEGVTTYDASLILQFVAGLLPSFPALSKPVASHWDAVFGDIAFNSDGSIECALMLDGDTPFVAGDFRFTYDNTLFSLDTIEPSASIGEMMNIIAYRDGEVIVLFAGSEPAEPGGDIVRLKFSPLSETDKSAQPVLTLTKAQVNEIDIITGIEDFSLSNNLIPDEFVLKGNTPNPFNPSTVIHFGISNDQNVEIKIYNINGQLIREITTGLLSAGYHSVIWNSRNDHGEPVSSGVYIYQLKAGNKTLNSKMLLLR